MSIPKDDQLKEIELLLDINEDTSQTVRSIQQAKIELESAIDSLTDVLLLVDPDGKIIRGNRAVTQWNLGNAKEIEGLVFHQLFHPGCDDRKCHFNTYWALAREKLSKDLTFEYQYLDKRLDCYLLIQFRPISTESGGQGKSHHSDHHFAVMTVKDITQNKQAELQLARKSAELQTIFKAMPDQYIRLSRGGTVLDLRINQHSDSKVIPENGVGKQFDSYFPPSVARQFREAVEQVFREKQMVIVEYTLFRHNSEQFFEARLLLLPESNIMVINRNITEKKRLESIAESIDTMKNLGYIFSGIRHEIGNPINAIKMTMSVLKKNVNSFSPQKIEEYTDRALSEINRVEYLLKSFKSFNMFENVRIVSIHLPDFLEKFFSLMGEDFGRKGINISLSLEPGADCIKGDPRALSQALLNIIANAVDALKDRNNPAIEIRAQRLYDGYNRVAVCVADNGHGIREQDLHSIFKPFYTTKADGTGLGLVIVKKILSRMKGEITVESTENKGTQVTILLPADKC